eukprot:13229670-Heterocapsa_arctica.AAC.1
MGTLQRANKQGPVHQLHNIYMSRANSLLQECIEDINPSLLDEDNSSSLMYGVLGVQGSLAGVWRSPSNSGSLGGSHHRIFL